MYLIKYIWSSTTWKTCEDMLFRDIDFDIIYLTKDKLILYESIPSGCPLTNISKIQQTKLVTHLCLFGKFLNILPRPALFSSTPLGICHFRKKYIYIFLISDTFISNANARLKLVKNQANAKQHPKAELSLFGNYSHSSSTLSYKNKQKSKSVCIHGIIWLIIMKMKIKIKNISHRYDVNRPR